MNITDVILHRDTEFTVNTNDDRFSPKTNLHVKKGKLGERVTINYNTVEIARFYHEIIVDLLTIGDVETVGFIFNKDDSFIF